MQLFFKIYTEILLLFNLIYNFAIYNIKVYERMIAKELLKGSIKSIVLKLLTENDRMYGYELSLRVEELSHGSIKLTLGALYPILHKLESDGDVTTESEVINSRTRIYYKLTPGGYETAKVKIKELFDFVEIMQKLLNVDYGKSILQAI
jgi:PadR family transcriptional regulator, regulatory protein PadR